jgi:hypothetical protein
MVFLRVIRAKYYLYTTTVKLQLWFPTCLRDLPPRDHLLATGLLPLEVTRAYQEARALFWSTAMLVAQMLAWIAYCLRSAREFSGATPVAVPNHNGLTAHAACSTGKLTSTEFTLNDLINFVLRPDLELQPCTPAPQVADVLGGSDFPPCPTIRQCCKDRTR